MFLIAQIYKWSGKTLWRIWYNEEVVGEVVGTRMARKMEKALVLNGDKGKAIEILRKSLEDEKPGLVNFLHRDLVNALQRLL